MTSKPAARSRNEVLKEQSRWLRGTIAEGLSRAETGALAEDDTQLTKFHGIYQQDDRDLRAERRRKRLEPAYCFMARVRIPGGALTPAQWLALDRLADERANGTIRLTTRQSIQFHGIIKSNLKPAIQAINAALLDTIAACGDVNRNVMCSPNPFESRAHAAAYDLAGRIGRHLLPRTRAYHEIWIDGEQVVDGAAGARVEDDEPIYGPTYMPRKFKIAIAVPPVNDVDVYAHDLGFVAIVDGSGTITGYDIVVGGGMGMTHGEPRTYPRLGTVVGSCTPEEVIEVAEKVATVQRDFGDRADRKHARFKYTIDDRGIDWFKSELEARLGRPFAPARGFAFERTGDRYGWVQDHEGLWHFTLLIENGRVRDTADWPMRTGLRRIAEVLSGEFRITPNQNLTIARIAPEAKPAIEALLHRYGLTNHFTGLRLNAMACVALPTCGLALAESERFLPELVQELERVVEANGLRDDEIVVRMTGCPNGCARPYLAEIGLVGQAPGTYAVYLGAAFDGSRPNRLYAKGVKAERITALLEPLIAAYAREREAGERFGDFLIRAGTIPRPTGAPAEYHEAILEA